MLASPDRDCRSATHCGRRAPKHYRCQNSGANSVTRSASNDDALVFTYDNGEKALSAAKKAIKGPLITVFTAPGFQTAPTALR